MANVLPLPISGTGESVQELLLEQRDVLVRVENVLERSYSRLDIIQDVVTQSLGVQKQQLAMFQRQLENQEFANEEARREAARMRADSRIVSSSAAVQTEPSGGLGGIGTAASAALGGVAGGLAAGGLASALRGLAGRLLRGGGLIGIGTIFGEQIGNFLGTEAAAILEDLGVDPQFANEVGSAIRNNTQSVLVGAGISKLLLGRTLPGIIGGIIFNQLDLGRIFTPEGRVDLENGIRDWFERLRDGELTNEDIINGAIVGGAAAYGARQIQRGGQALGRRFPTFRPDGTVEGPGQAARPGAIRTPTTPYVRPRRANGQFMSDAEIEEMSRGVRNATDRARFLKLVKGLGAIGIVLTAVQLGELIQLLNSDASPQAKQEAVGAFIGGFIGGAAGLAAGAYIGAFGGPWGALIGGLLGGAGGALAGDQIGLLIARWAWDEEPPRAEIGGIGSQADVDAYLREMGVTPTAPATPSGTVTGGRGTVVEAPGARALANQISGVQTQLDEARQERAEASNRAARRDAQANVTRLERALEDLEEQLEELNETFKSTSVVPSDASFNVDTGGARIYNAALSTNMNTGVRPVQAAFTPSFGQPQLIRASLGATSTPRVSTQGSQAGMTDDQRKAYMVYSAFLDAGFSDSQAKALVGEVYRENSFQERYWYGTHTDPANQATNAGIISWQGPRKTALYNYLGDRGLLNEDGSMKRGYETLVAQAEFLREEMRTGSAGGSTAQISRYQDWYRSEEVSPEESIRVLGGDFIRWRLNDPRYRSSGLANIEYGRSQIEGLELPSAPDRTTPAAPDTMIADAPQAQPPVATPATPTRPSQPAPDTRPSRVAPAPRQPSTGGDLEAGQSVMGSFAQAIQSLTGTGFGFDALFGEGTYASILTSSNPEQFLAEKLSNVFNRNQVGVTPAAVEINRGSERATAAPVVINAPVVNNDNSVNGGGSNGRTMASQERAIPVITDRSLASTVSEWWDATMA